MQASSEGQGQGAGRTFALWADFCWCWGLHRLRLRRLGAAAGAWLHAAAAGWRWIGRALRLHRSEIQLLQRLQLPLGHVGAKEKRPCCRRGAGL